MSPASVVDYFKTVVSAARTLKLSPPTVHGWIDAGEIPIDRQCQIEIITEGALRADRDENGLPVKRDSRSRHVEGTQ